MTKRSRDAKGRAGLKYRSLGQLLDELCDTEEFPETTATIKRFKFVREAKCLTKADLVEVCHWKSPRAIHWIRQNSPAKIKRVTRKALTTKSERRKIEYLTSLDGVGIPMASAILMLTGPKRYGVLDIRVWRLLYALGSVTKNPRGIGFKFNNWFQYLKILRHHAERLNVTVRDIERSLFKHHKEIQKGPLYGRQGKRQ